MNNKDRTNKKDRKNTKDKMNKDNKDEKDRKKPANDIGYNCGPRLHYKGQICHC